MRILDFVSGVERWKVTPSKSETTWSIEIGGALYHSQKLCRVGVLQRLPGKAFCEQGLNQDILVVEEEHSFKMLETPAAS